MSIFKIQAVNLPLEILRKGKKGNCTFDMNRITNVKCLPACSTKITKPVVGTHIDQQCRVIHGYLWIFYIYPGSDDL